MTRITKEELLEKLFHDDYEHLKGKRLRMTRVRVPGKEVCLAHIISTSQTSVYQNLGFTSEFTKEKTIRENLLVLSVSLPGRLLWSLLT